MTPILGGFKSANYKCEREWAVAKDGAKIPISIVYRKDLAKLDGSDPMLLDAYGSYGICNDPRSVPFPSPTVVTPSGSEIGAWKVGLT